MRPRNPEWRAAVEGDFAAASFIRHLGIRPTAIEPGLVRTEMAIGRDHQQQAGWIHAGVQATLADHSSGCSAGTLMGADEGVVSVEFKVNLLRPARGERLYCEARVIKPGRRFAVVEARVHTGDRQKPTALMISTMAYVSRSG